MHDALREQPGSPSRRLSTGVVVVARLIAVALIVTALVMLATDRGPQGRILWQINQNHGVHIGDFFEVGMILLGGLIFVVTHRSRRS